MTKEVPITRPRLDREKQHPPKGETIYSRAEQKSTQRHPYLKITANIVSFASIGLLLSRHSDMWKKHEKLYNEIEDKAKKAGKSPEEIEDILNRVAAEAVEPLKEAYEEDQS